MFRQAVIVIHGIGEQRPMDTLRGFVDAVLPEPRSDQVKYHSVPDRMSELFELRRLLAPQTRSRPKTDFYEYYWAYQMCGTRHSHVASWVKALILRRPSLVSRRLLPLWLVSWAVIISLVVTSVRLLPHLLGTAEGDPLQRIAFWVASAILVLAVNAFAINYLGDAARYLSPKPGNIAIRQRIRTDGVRLLRQLHESRKYDRIVVVGHSLGSIIAYDILKYYWHEVSNRHSKPPEIDQSELKKFDDACKLLESETASEEGLDGFRDLQESLWREQRRLGNPWLVTDLVTVGSPLAHAGMLLANSPEEFLARKREMELPGAPPVRDFRGEFSYKREYEMGGQKRTIRLLNHGALFACTRWTNVWFPGDIVGGPIAPLFGPAVKDRRVRDGWISFTPLSHTRYWPRPAAKGRPPASLSAIREGMDLDSKKWL